VLLAYRCALASPRVSAAAIEASEFASEADRHGVVSVPAIVIDGRQRYAGAVPEPVFVQRLLAAVGDPPT
jgi:predicted thioredoxin/glutaredoxin